mgnify:CR=1 FL=1
MNAHCIYGLTMCVTCWREGRGNAQDHDSAKARKMLLNRGTFPPVRCTLCWVACSFLRFFAIRRIEQSNDIEAAEDRLQSFELNCHHCFRQEEPDDTWEESSHQKCGPMFANDVPDPHQCFLYHVSSLCTSTFFLLLQFMKPAPNVPIQRRRAAPSAITGG